MWTVNSSWSIIFLHVFNIHIIWNGRIFNPIPSPVCDASHYHRFKYVSDIGSNTFPDIAGGIV